MNIPLLSYDEAAVILLALALFFAAIATSTRAASNFQRRIHELSKATPLLAAEPDVEMGEWPIPRSSRLMRECLAGGDLHITRLAAAGQIFCDVLEKLGPFKVILAEHAPTHHLPPLPTVLSAPPHAPLASHLPPR